MHFTSFITVVAILSFVTPAASQQTAADKDTSSSRIPVQDAWLASDKAFHLASSAFLAAGGFYFLHEEQNLERDKSLLISASVSLAIGIGKEIYDRRHPRHVASWKDLVADLAGIGLTILILKQ